MKMVKNVQKNVIIVVIICLLVFAIFFLISGINSNNNDTPLYSYTANKSGDYQVLLKENNFYENQILAPDNYYASKSIDKYLLKFKYDFNAEKIKNIEYRYDITAQLVGIVSNNNEQEKEIWTKNFTLLDDKKDEINQNKFSIIENVDIDYEYYNNLARDYEDNYGISINAILKVRFNIFCNIKFENENIENAEDYIELDIALTNNVSNIEKNYEDVTKKELFLSSKDNAIIYYIVSGVAIIIAIILIIMKNRNKKTPEEIYRKKVKYILKNYSELMVTVSNEPNVENYTVMKIDNLEDLIDLAEQNKINIIHYESIKNKQNNFYVFVDKFVYMYLL